LWAERSSTTTTMIINKMKPLVEAPEHGLKGAARGKSRANYDATLKTKKKTKKKKRTTAPNPTKGTTKIKNREAKKRHHTLRAQSTPSMLSRKKRIAHHSSIRRYTLPDREVAGKKSDPDNCSRRYERAGLPSRASQVCSAGHNHFCEKSFQGRAARKEANYLRGDLFWVTSSFGKTPGCFKRETKGKPRRRESAVSRPARERGKRGIRATSSYESKRGIL